MREETEISTTTGFHSIRHQDEILDDEVGKNVESDVCGHSDIKTKFYFYITSLVIAMSILIAVHVIAFVTIYLFDHCFNISLQVRSFIFTKNVYSVSETIFGFLVVQQNGVSSLHHSGAAVTMDITDQPRNRPR